MAELAKRPYRRRFRELRIFPSGIACAEVVQLEAASAPVSPGLITALGDRFCALRRLANASAARVLRVRAGHRHEAPKGEVLERAKGLTNGLAAIAGEVVAVSSYGRTRKIELFPWSELVG